MKSRSKTVYALLVCLLSATILATGGMVDGATAELGPSIIFLPLLARPGATVIPETTKMLNQNTTQYLQSVSEDGSLFTFSQMTGELAAVQEGDVIIGLPIEVVPYGFLRKVDQIYQQAGKVLIETKPAALEEAIERGTIEAKWQLRPEDIPQSALPPGMSVRTMPDAGDEDLVEIILDHVFLDDGGGECEVNGRLLLATSSEMEVVIEWFTLKEFRFEQAFTEETAISVTCTSSYSRHESIDLLDFDLPGFTVPVGPVIIPVTPHLTVSVGFDGQLDAEMHTGVTQQATLTGGIKYENGEWGPISSFSNEVNFSPPTLSATLHAQAYATAELGFMIAGAAGPDVEISPYLLLEADTNASPWWQLFCGFEGAVGLEADLFDVLEVEYRATIIDYRKLLLSPPNKPAGPSPADGAADQSVDVNLSWTGGDLDGDLVTYDVYLEADSSVPGVLRCNAVLLPQCDPGQLSYDSLYYWQVVARDEHGFQTWGPVWEFTTEALAPPEITSFTATPQTICQGTTATLSWSVDGQVDSLSLQPGIGDVTGQSSMVVMPSETETYTLTAQNAAGSSRAEVTVVVEDCNPSSDEVILFTLGRDSSAELYTIRPDGSDLKRLTDNDVLDWHPRIAPDGSKIATCRGEAGKAWLVVMDPEGGNERYVTDQFSCSSAWGWFPDSSRIVYSGSGNTLSIVELATGAISYVPTGTVNPDHLDLSPDGAKVVFDGWPWALWVMNTDGTGLTSLGSWSPRVSEWSPDGTRIAFERYLGQLYVINSDGSGAKRIPTGASVFAPTWSPDGTRIAYTTFGSQLRIIGVDGANDHLVPNLPSGYIENADWGEIRQ